MSSRNGLRVFKQKATLGRGKDWMWAETKPGGSPVGFADWFDMIQVFIECETEKYGGDPDNAEDRQRWSSMGKAFLMACFDEGVTYEDLAAMYGLKDR